MSYVIDVYKGRVSAQKNYFKVLLYISFFPQLIAGPIVKYRDIVSEIDNRTFNSQQASAGFRRFICGLGKKVIIANTMGEVADAIFSTANTNVNILVAWLGAVAYMFQIYYDFSGYSDMAIGMGKMFGFNFKENFIYPYGASSIKEFWHRWHISLSTWFKEYLYIPLGGNRKGKARTAINKIIVFACTGLWHGANWTFVVWGLYHGLFLLFEDAIKGKIKVPKFVKHIYTLIVVCIGFVIFRADTIGQGLFMVKQMFAGYNFSANCTTVWLEQLTPWFIVILVAGIIGCAPIQKLSNKLTSVLDSQCVTAKSKVIKVGIYCVSVCLLVWCAVRLSGNTYNPFIYFRF
jgi:alginate O-acetyltransferase complex protein AlgI